MLVVLIRSIILYLAVLISLRIMGKGEIAEMNSYDLVITLLIADVVSMPMENNNIPMINAIASLVGLVLMQTIISYLTSKNRTFNSILSGKSSILINNGNIDMKVLKNERISIDELLEQLRVQGYFNLKDVQYAILETDGNLSIVPTPTYKSVPTVSFNHLPISLIIDGQEIKDGLKSINKDSNWLLGIIKSHNFNNVKDVLVCILDEHDKIFIQGRNK